ncbi:MAG TPA: hypothetical protein VKG44_04930 [Candidatus Baltobacteraceae bacterium]|nr:hypothetical protein [Candidatus Baltobacteraceae bacterium]
METIPPELSGAARAARERFVELSQRTAQSNTASRGGMQSTMAAAAGEAIRADAFLAAVRSRLEELRSVTK